MDKSNELIMSLEPRKTDSPYLGSTYAKIPYPGSSHKNLSYLLSILAHPPYPCARKAER